VTTATGTYALEGQLLEVCNCGTLCPCWIGEDPDNGTCDSFLAYHVERGQIKGVDVSGLNWVAVVHIPGNVLQGNFQGVFFVDARGTPEQREALRAAFRGELGGPLADLAKLVGQELAMRVAPIECEVVEGRGVLRIPDVLEAQMEPYKSPTGETTKLVDSIFSTIPGSPAYVSKASLNRASIPEFNMVWEYHGLNAIQGVFRIEA